MPYQSGAQVFLADAVDDLDDHGYNDQAYAKAHGQDQGRHNIFRFHGLHPQRRDHMLKTEQASVHKSEKYGKQSAEGDDPGNIHMFQAVE